MEPTLETSYPSFWDSTPYAINLAQAQEESVLLRKRPQKNKLKS